MKTKSTLAAALIAGGALLGTMTAMAYDQGTTDRSHPKAFVKDSAITAKIKTQLAEDHLTSLAKIHVDTDDDGIVWLKGSTASREAADRAVAIARATEHVKDVHSDIVVKHDE
jgi:hyperosmotically inducible protein